MPIGGKFGLAEFCRMHLYLLHFYWLSGVYIRVHLRGHYRDINIPTFPLSFNQPYHRLASPTRITDSSHRISLASFVVVLLLAKTSCTSTTWLQCCGNARHGNGKTDHRNQKWTGHRPPLNNTHGQDTKHT